MVDWAARISAAAKLEPGESVLGGAEFTGAAFAMFGAASAGGFLNMRKPAQSPDAAIDIPRRGIAIGVTQHRILVFELAGFGRVKDRLAEVHLDDVARVVVQETPGKAVRIQPPSTLVRFVLVDDTEISGSMVSVGPTGRANQTLLDALEQARPGLISR